MKPITFSIQQQETQKWWLFLAYSVLSILFLYTINDIIITDPQALTGGNESSVKLFRNVYLVIYYINPLYALLKISFIAIILQQSSKLFFDTEIKYSQLFTLVLIAEFVLLVPDFLECIWFLFIHTEYTMVEVQAFYPFSVYSLFNPDNVSQSYDYILKLINPFEIAYWLMLVLGLKELTGKTLKDGLKTVAGSYGVMLLLIIVVRYYIFSSILHE